MKNLNRRQWLRRAGLLSGGLSVLGAAPASAIPPFHDYLQTLEPPATPPGPVLKLSSNENPYGPSEQVRKAIAGAFDSVCRYPSHDRTELRRRLADREGVTPEHILITVGSTEGLKITALAFGLYGGEIVAGSPTFETMLHYAENFDADVVRVPVDENLVLDVEEMEKRITGNTRLVFLCNPNNPTGTILPAAKLKSFCEAAAHKTIVFSDEAYYDYITEPDYPSMVEMVKDNRNVIVSRTFSKVYGLAGIRIGYLVARPDLIVRLKKCQADRPNMLALHAALAALDEPDFYQFSLQKNAEARQKIYTVLDDLGLRYVPSHANFVFCQTGRPIADFHAQMLAEGVRVGRPFPPLTDWCRLSTGRVEDMDTLAAALRRVMA